MSTPRRRIIRPTAILPGPDNHEKIQKLRSRLQQEHRDFARWMTRLKRAFHVVEKVQQKINRLERQIAQLEGGNGLHQRNGIL